jgi:hypothetical protein
VLQTTDFDVACCKLPISTLHAAARCAPHRSRCCRCCQSKAAAIIIDYKLFDYTNSAKLGSLLRRERTSHTLKRRELKCTFTYGRCNGPHAARRAATLAPPPQQPRACAQPAEGGGGAAAVDGPRRLRFAVPRELQGT